MIDIQAQITILRAKIAEHQTLPATVERPSRPKANQALTALLESWEYAQEVTTEKGTHFECEKLYPAHARHGSMDVGSLSELPGDSLCALGQDGFPACEPAKWAFLDTETTGLAGGSGTYAFLVGVGRIGEDGFRVRQFFMRDYSEEASMLTSLSQHLATFEVLITYNGRTFDQPLLETRYRMTRSRPPFARMAHLDLLLGARRLWKLRFDSCRLVELESQILGIERVGDVPGAMIPFVYFEYVRTSRAFRLGPVFEHNSLDIVTLACLTAIVPRAFQSAGAASFPVQHPAERVGLGRWLRQAGQFESAAEMFRKALSEGLKDDLTWRTLWDLAAMERKLEKPGAALAIYSELASTLNPYHSQACEELAKHYEHKERNPSMAMEFVLTAMESGASPALEKRKSRLTEKMRKPRRLL